MIGTCQLLEAPKMQCGQVQGDLDVWRGECQRWPDYSALRYRNAGAAIDWLCGAFGFERKMVVPADGGRAAHAELTFGNGMIMLGDVETEYGRLVAAPTKGEPAT